MKYKSLNFTILNLTYRTSMKSISSKWRRRGVVRLREWERSQWTWTQMCTVRDVFDKTGFKDGNFRVHVLTSLKLGGCHEPKLVFILNNGVSVAVLCSVHVSHFCRRVTCRRVMLFYWRVTCHCSVFSKFSPRHPCFASSVINFQPLKLISMPILAHNAGSQTLPSPPSGHPYPSPPSGLLPPILLA